LEFPGQIFRNPQIRDWRWPGPGENAGATLQNCDIEDEKFKRQHRWQIERDAIRRCLTLFPKYMHGSLDNRRLYVPNLAADRCARGEMLPQGSAPLS